MKKLIIKFYKPIIIHTLIALFVIMSAWYRDYKSMGEEAYKSLSAQGYIDSMIINRECIAANKRYYGIFGYKLYNNSHEFTDDEEGG